MMMRNFINTSVDFYIDKFILRSICKNGEGASVL